MPIALADLLTEQQVVLRLRSRRPANAIREIVDVLASDISGRKIAKPEAFLEQVFAREQTHSSVVENGVVFPHARTKGVVKTVPTRLDPEQHSNDGQVKKENNVRHSTGRKSDCNDGSATGNGPVGRHIQPLPPYHASPQLAPIKMGHSVDIARIVKAPLQGNCPFLFRRYRCILSCHSLLFNWITGFAA